MKGQVSVDWTMEKAVRLVEQWGLGYHDGGALVHVLRGADVGMVATARLEHLRRARWYLERLLHTRGERSASGSGGSLSERLDVIERYELDFHLGTVVRLLLGEELRGWHIREAILCLDRHLDRVERYVGAMGSHTGTAKSWWSLERLKEASLAGPGDLHVSQPPAKMRGTVPVDLMASALEVTWPQETTTADPRWFGFAPENVCAASPRDAVCGVGRWTITEGPPAEAPPSADVQTAPEAEQAPTAAHSPERPKAATAAATPPSTPAKKRAGRKTGKAKGGQKKKDGTKKAPLTPRRQRALPSPDSRHGMVLTAMLQRQGEADAAAVVELTDMDVKGVSTALGLLSRQWPRLVKKVRRGVYTVTPEGRAELEQAGWWAPPEATTPAEPAATESNETPAPPVSGAAPTHPLLTSEDGKRVRLRMKRFPNNVVYAVALSNKPGAYDLEIDGEMMGRWWVGTDTAARGAVRILKEREKEQEHG